MLCQHDENGSVSVVQRRSAIKATVAAVIGGTCLGVVNLVDPEITIVSRLVAHSQLPTIKEIQAAYEASLATPNAAAFPGLMIVASRCTEGRRGSFLCEVKYQSQADLKKKISDQTDLVAVNRNSDGTWNLLSGMCRPSE
jgi:hypothetical protein